jgi:uncharacterized protein YbjT (DUF2867 family)
LTDIFHLKDFVMNYAITGAAGHIAKPLAGHLLKSGQKVTVIGRNEDHLKELVQAGAKTAIGTVEDVEFLKAAFAGADAVFTLCPPLFSTTDIKIFYKRLGENYAEAIQANGIHYVVNLSSVGAHLPQGTGPVSGLHEVEEILNTLPEVHIKHLRPVYFYTNLRANIDMIKQMGIMGSNFAIAPKKFPLVDPADISAVAAAELLKLDFSGHSVRYIASDETGTDEIAAVLGKSIGKPELKWVKFTDEQVYESMLQTGLPKELVGAYVEMFHALDSGKLTEDYWLHHPARLGSTKLEDFANVFAAIYHGNQP